MDRRHQLDVQPGRPDGTATFTNTGPDHGRQQRPGQIGAVLFTAAPNAQAYTININDIVPRQRLRRHQQFDQHPDVQRSAPRMVFQNSSSRQRRHRASYLQQQRRALSFNDTSTAGTATIINNGDVEFNDTSTAGSRPHHQQCRDGFLRHTSAGTATITNNGTLTFNSTATADRAIPQQRRYSSTIPVSAAAPRSPPATAIIHLQQYRHGRQRAIINMPAPPSDVQQFQFGRQRWHHRQRGLGRRRSPSTTPARRPARTSRSSTSP